MREKGQTEVAKTLETPVFSRGIEILTEKEELLVMIALGIVIIALACYLVYALANPEKF